MLIETTKLRDCARELLLAAGESPENAQTVSEIFVKCDARGITTHGTYLLNPIFDRVRKGQFRFPTNARVGSDRGATAVVDGGDGLGAVAAKLAVQVAAKKAREYGVGTVLIRETNNVGALGVYTELAAKEGTVSFFCCNASPAMSPWGGMEPFFGTQPFSIGIYTGRNSGFTFSADMSTSIVARGKIRKALRNGEKIPDTWALDPEGNPTTDPGKAIEGTVLPIGGPKGSAIALTIDILAGMLSGSHYAPNVRPIHTPSGTAGVGGALTVIDIAHFMDLDLFEEKLSEYIARAKQLKRAAGFDEILMPGESSQGKERSSMEKGVSLDDNAVEALNKLLEEIGSNSRLTERI